MNLIIKCNIHLGGSASETPEDVKNEVMESLQGLFDDVSFTSAGDQIETQNNIIDVSNRVDFTKTAGELIQQIPGVSITKRS
jgi:hypothetical protein